MSDINLDFTVSNNSIDFTVQPNDITITPEEILLTLNANFKPLAGGSNTQLQYNLNGTLDGIPNVTYDGSNISLGNVSTVKITGGTNGYVLQTDGTGNLDWTAMTGGGGNGTPGGSNTQIQYNDAGAFGGNAGFTFNEVSGNVAMPSNLSVVGNITANYIIANLGGNAVNSNYASYAGNVTIASQPNITSVGTLTTLSVAGNSNTGNIYTSGTSGNISGANVISANTFTATGNITANYFIGNGSLLTGVTGASSIANGNSNVNIATSNGNVTVTAGGTTSLTVSNTNVTARQFISNVANGTAPFVVTSTTTVANLRANVANYVSTTAYSGSAFLYPLVTTTTGTGVVSALVSGSFAFNDATNTLHTNLSGSVSNATSISGGNLTVTGNVQSNNIIFTSSIASNVTPNVAVSTTITDKLPIVLNGVTYYICLTTSV